MIALRTLIIGLFCASFGLSYGQGLTKHFDSGYFESQHFAHRGGYATGPENTLKTILDNIHAGVNAIEIDVRLTKDHALVLFHDETLKRVLNTENDCSVGDITLNELLRIPLRDSSDGVQYVCSLASLIDTLVYLVPKQQIEDFILEVDFKASGSSTKVAIDALLAILDTHYPVIGDDIYNFFFISSFYPGVLKELYQRNPKVHTAFAINNASEEQKLKAKIAVLMAGFVVRKYNARIIEPNLCMVTERFVRKWHRRGILINTYTANTVCEKEYLDQFKIAYTTNCPLDVCKPDSSDQLGKPKKWCKNCR